MGSIKHFKWYKDKKAKKKAQKNSNVAKVANPKSVRKCRVLRSRTGKARVRAFS